MDLLHRTDATEITDAELQRLYRRIMRAFQEWAHDEFGCELPWRPDFARALCFGAPSGNRDDYAIEIVVLAAEDRAA